ncbi:hypothetical protein [Leptolyngbya sp. 7M]|uniref:hypothetical protein n=1 Tax=Leptolyngbya sp. 7M TaxID=2812896 RepID=UPI001B8B7612|nr:hypothetical protein [Leptolyngbya sp. 7M]QYO66604.1 hypothetical protein JVX88_07325 [Leptolyngbya sp. 7M]
MSRSLLITFFLATVIATSPNSVVAQRKNSKPGVEAKTVVQNTPEPTQSESKDRTSESPVKKNDRIQSSTSNPPTVVQQRFTHIYEFSQPDFVVSKIYIRHDDNGKGEIEFRRKGNDESFTDPVELTPVTLSKISAALAELNFLDSKEDYQYNKDFSHLGTMKFTLSRDERTRTVEFNWTSNKNAKALMDEYRRIGFQYIWIFDVTVACENQPLDTPRLMNTLESYLRRGEISDPPQMVPVLTKLSENERLPLIARNHAERLIKQINKQAK